MIHSKSNIEPQTTKKEMFRLKSGQVIVFLIVLAMSLCTIIFPSSAGLQVFAVDAMYQHVSTSSVQQEQQQQEEDSLNSKGNLTNNMTKDEAQKIVKQAVTPISAVESDGNERIDHSG